MRDNFSQTAGIFSIAPAERKGNAGDRAAPQPPNAGTDGVARRFSSQQEIEMMRNDDPNSAGFLAIILAGIMLVVGGLLLMGDAARWDRPTLVAERHQTSTLHKADQRRERF